MSWVVDAFGPWYPLVYPHRDQAEADRWIDALDDVVGWSGGRVLDVGCGTGRHLAPLQRCGARPVGLDYSPSLLALAAASRAAARARWPLVRGDMRALPFAGGSFDVVGSFFTSFGYFGPEEDRRVVAEAARVLRPGGFHVLDYLNRAHVLAHPMRVAERTQGELVVREAKRLEDGGRTVVKDVRIRRAGPDGSTLAAYEERVTLYRWDEVHAFLEGEGLRVAHVFGDYDRSTFHETSSARRIVVSRKEPA
jgi:SAM-dependent methyltransferase